VLLVIPLALALLPRWQVKKVDIQRCPGVPERLGGTLMSLVGTPVVLLDLDWVRNAVDVWPGVAGVEVRLKRLGTLSVKAYAAGVAGSLAVGRGWRAVCPDGTLGPRLDARRDPVLVNFPRRPERLREGLSVAERLARELGRPVESVRRVMPDDFEVVFARRPGDRRPFAVHVAARASGGERMMGAMVRSGALQDIGWADLRQEDRLVVGGQG